MSPPDSGEREAPEDLAGKLRLALSMFDLGVAMKEQSIRRERPGLSDEEVKEELRVWLQTRPGAEFGDCIGRPVPPESFRGA